MIYFHRSFKICCKLVVERDVFVIWLLFIQPHFLVELFVRSANNKHMSNKTSRLHGGFNDKLLTFCKSLWLRCILQVLLASPTLRYCYQRQFVKEKTSSIYYGEVYSYAIENHIVLSFCCNTFIKCLETMKQLLWLEFFVMSKLIIDSILKNCLWRKNIL